MKQILVVDDEPARAEFVRNLLKEKKLPETLSLQLKEFNAEESHKLKGVALVHWSMIDRAYSFLARLRAHSGIRIIFYCLCAEMRIREQILLLPQEIDALISQLVLCSVN